MPIDSVQARSAQAALWSVVGAVGKVVGQFVIQITLARLLGPHDFGEFAAVIVVLSLCYLVCDAGFGSALIQKRDISEQDIQVVLGWSLVIAVVVASGTFLSAPLLADFFGDPALKPMFRVCGLLVLLQPLISQPLNLMRRDLNFKVLQLIHLVAYILIYGCIAISLALLGWGGWSLVIAYLGQTLFVLVVARTLQRTSLRPRLCGSSSLIKFGLKSMLTDMATWALEYVDQLMIGRFWAIRSLGLYAAAMNLCKAPTGLIVNSLQNIAFSSAARLQDNLAIIRNGYSGVLAAMALMTLPVFSLLSQHADVVLRIVYGNKWLDAAPLTTALAIAMPAVAMGTITAAILRGTGAVTPELRIQIFSVSALTVLLLLMVGKPLTIAVIAVPIVYWCRLALLMLAVGKRLKMRAIDFYVAIRGGALLAGIGIGAGALSKSWLSSSESLYGALPLAATCCSVLLAALVGRSWLVSKPLAEILQYRFLSRYSGRLLSHITGARK